VLGGASGCLLRIVEALDKDAFEPVVLLKGEGIIADHLRAAGATVYIVPAIHPAPYSKSLLAPRTLWQYALAWLSIRRIAKCIRKTEAKLVHLNSVMLYPYLKSAHISDCPVVIHAREHWPEDSYQRQFRLLQSHVQRYATAIVANNKTSAAMFGVPGKTTIIYDWIDFSGSGEHFDLRQFGDVDPAKHRLFLFLGGIQPIKGTLEILQAFQAADLGEDARLLFVGGQKPADGPIIKVLRGLLHLVGRRTYSDRVQQVTQASNNRIIVMPATSRVKSLIEQSDVMVSFVSRPHAILPLAEAAWLGKPSIAVDTPEVGEYTGSGAGAILLPMSDTQGLQIAMRRLASDRALADEMGQMGTVMVRELFEKDSNVQRLESLYRSILGT